MLKADELRSLTEEELVSKHNTLKEELYKLRSQVKTGKLEKPSRISEIRKEIARIFTVQRERKLSDERKDKKA